MTMRMLAALGVIAAAAQPLSLSAQKPDKALTILADARKAIGGTDGLRAISLESANQRNLGQLQISSTSELLMELPDKYVRSETIISPGTGTTTSGFNGSTALTGGVSGSGGGLVIRVGPGGGSFGGSGGGDKPTPEQQAQLDQTMVRAARADLSRMMLGWFAMAHPSIDASYAYAGEAESPDGKAFMVDATGADGFKARLFIDEQTHLPLMVTYQGPQPRVVTVNRSPSDHGAAPSIDDLKKEPTVMADYTLYFDDWRDTGGLKFPFKLRRAMAGTTTEEWTVSKVKVNPKIDGRKFEPAK